MKVNKNYEAELNLKDLLFHVLYKWRIILLVGLIAAGIFGFREYWSYEKYHRAGQLTPAEIQYEAEFTANQNAIAQTEKDIAAYDKLIQEKTNYRDTSILMKMDPMNIWTAEKTYYLNLAGSETDHSATTIMVLIEAFSKDIDSETLMNVFGTTSRNDINEVASISANRGLRTIMVVCCGSTEEEALKRREFVDACLHETEQKLKETLVFTLDPVSESVGTKTVLTNRNINGDMITKDLAYTQNIISEEIRNYENQRNTYIPTLNDLKSVKIIKPVQDLKGQVFFGFVFGAVLTMIVYIIIYLFNGKLKTLREMKNRYEISILGEADHSRAWWKGKGLDWVIEHLEFGKKKINPESTLERVISLIDSQKDGQRILLTGTLEEKRMMKVYEILSSGLQKKGITLTLQADYLHNNEAVEVSGNMDSVILVEEKYKSRVRDMNRMAEMLTIENSKILGVVLM